MKYKYKNFIKILPDAKWVRYARVFFLLVVLPATSFQFATAQMLGTHTFKIIEGTQGLKITCLYKSHNGYILAGTAHGLYRFDGTEFTAIQSTSSFADPSICSIFQTSDQTIWLGMQNGDIAYEAGKRIQKYDPPEGTPKKRITAFLEDLDHKLWFSTDGEGLYYSQNNHLYNINVDDGLGENNVYALALAADGRILAGTDQGLSIINIKNGKKEIVNLNSTSGLPDNFIKTIINAGNGLFWIGMQDKGFCLFDVNKTLFTIPAVAKDWTHGQINSLLNTQGRLWIATESEGLFYYRGDKSALTVSRLKEKPLSLVNTVISDNEGNLWMVANSTDLIKTAGSKLELHIPYEANGMTEIHAILSDHNNIDWTGDDTGITEYQETATGEHRRKVHVIKELGGRTDIIALYEDLNHHIWVGTMDRGIFIFDPNTGKYRHLNENRLLEKGSILSISGRDKYVFVSSLEGSTMFELSPENKNLSGKYKSSDYSDISGVGSNIIYSIYKDSKGRVWFATDGRGIVMLENNKYSNYTETAGLKDKFIYSITEDKKGNIWFSTRDAGIYKYDGKIFRNYAIADGLSDLNVSAIKTDGQGNLVIIHKKGIDILDPETNSFSYFNNSHGITELNVRDLGSVAQDVEGNILFSSADGVIRYSPVSKTLHKPAIILESVQLFFDTLADNVSHQFDYDENSFTFNFTGLYYTEPDAVQYQYMLEGYSNVWTTTKDRSISFPRLPAGKYIFRVRSSINQFFEGADEARFAFSIKKAFWTTWWFILLTLTVMGTLIYLYIKSRERNLKKVERLHQEKIQFQFETLRNQVNPHFLFNSFNTLISTIEDDPKMAVEYVEQLSDFFRNIVTYRDKDVISLREEITVLQTYFYIQQKRFGKNLNLIIELSDRERSNIFIPPLTLQLLAENAIKHNAVSKETPLAVEIYTEDNRLIVRNNLNAKLNQAVGAGMGLQNIINRYNLLSTKKVEVQKSSSYFTIYLPILKHDQ